MSDAFNTTRFGKAQGHGAERKMTEKIGEFGFQKTYRTNPDGSVTMLTTHDGWNRFTTDGGGNKTNQLVRGFGLVPLTRDKAVIFDPDDWTTLSKTYTPLNPTFHVMNWATDIGNGVVNSKNWYDVVSFGDGILKINGVTDIPLKVGAVSVPSAVIPFVVAITPGVRDSTLYGSPGQAHVFFTSKVAVYSAKDGVVTSTVMTPQTPMLEGRAYLGGQLVTGTTIVLRQLFYIGGFESVSWQCLYARYSVNPTTGGVTTVEHTFRALEMPAPALGDPENKVYTSREDYSVPDIHIGERCSAEIEDRAYYGTGVLIGITVIFKPNGQMLSTPSSGFCSWGNYDLVRKGEINTSFSMAGIAFSYLANVKKTAFTSDGIVYREAGTWEEPSFGEGNRKCTFSIGAGWEPPLPTTNSVLTIGWFEGEVNVDARQHKEGATHTTSTNISAVTGSGFPLQLLKINTSRSSGWKHLTTITQSSPQPAQPIIVARGGVEVYTYTTYSNRTPEEERAVEALIASTTPMLGVGVATYFDLKVIAAAQYGNANPQFPHTVNVNEGYFDTASITGTSIDYFIFDEANRIYGSINGSLSASESDGDASVTLTVTALFSTPNGSYSHQLFSRSLRMSSILPYKFIDGIEPYIPAPIVRCLFAPKVMSQGCFHGITYTTMDEVAAGAQPHFFANFTFALAGYGGGCENSESEGTGTHLDIMPGHLLEMLYCYVYSSEYGSEENYGAYPVTRASVFKLINDNLFTKSFHVHLHNNASGSWTGNVDLLPLDHPSTEIFRI